MVDDAPHCIALSHVGGNVLKYRCRAQRCAVAIERSATWLRTQLSALAG